MRKCGFARSTFKRYSVVCFVSSCGSLFWWEQRLLHTSSGPHPYTTRFFNGTATKWHLKSFSTKLYPNKIEPACHKSKILFFNGLLLMRSSLRNVPLLIGLLLDIITKHLTSNVSERSCTQARSSLLVIRKILYCRMVYVLCVISSVMFRCWYDSCWPASPDLHRKF